MHRWILRKLLNSEPQREGISLNVRYVNDLCMLNAKKWRSNSKDYPRHRPSESEFFRLNIGTLNIGHFTRIGRTLDNNRHFSVCVAVRYQPMLLAIKLSRQYDMFDFALSSVARSVGVSRYTCITDQIRMMQTWGADRSASSNSIWVQLSTQKSTEGYWRQTSAD